MRKKMLYFLVLCNVAIVVSTPQIVALMSHGWGT